MRLDVELEVCGHVPGIEGWVLTIAAFHWVKRVPSEPSVGIMHDSHEVEPPSDFKARIGYGDEDNLAEVDVVLRWDILQPSLVERFEMAAIDAFEKAGKDQEMSDAAARYADMKDDGLV